MLGSTALFWLTPGRSIVNILDACAVRIRPLGRRIPSVRSRAERDAAQQDSRALALSGIVPLLHALGQGFASALTLPHLVWAFAGVTLGTAVGVLPGIGPALTIALLLPATFTLEPTSAFIMFAGIYYGAMYGGSTTSILLNTPGETASIVTAIDGHLMARQGRGAAALTTAAIGSFVAGTLATVAVAFFAPPLALFALRFGSAEYFALAGACRPLSQARLSMNQTEDQVGLGSRCSR